MENEITQQLPPGQDAGGAAAPDPKAHIAKLEQAADISFRSEHGGRRPSRAELEVEAHDLAQMLGGKGYFELRKEADNQPGPVSSFIRKGIGVASDAAVGLASGAASTLSDRTESLRARDSSLPTLRVPSMFQGAANAITPEEVNVLPVNGKPYASFRPQPLGDMVFGAEDLADAVEMGLPLATEMIVLSGGKATPQGYITKTLAANIGAEVTAEFIRAMDRRVADLPNSAVNVTDPGDAVQHLAKVAAGGALLGGADLLINSRTLAAQRQLYKRTFGLSTSASREKVARMGRLGIDPSLAEASDGWVTAITASLAVYPITARLALRKSRDTTKQLSANMGFKLGQMADHLGSGVFLHNKSARWFSRNDSYLQYVRKSAGNTYEAATKAVVDAETKLGRDAVHVPHHQIKRELEDTIIGRAIGVPLGAPKGKFGHQDAFTSSLMEDKDWPALERLMNMEDTPSIIEYRELRNQIESAAGRLSGENDRFSEVYVAAASKMRKALDNIVAPPEIKRAYQIADQKWSDMHALTSEATWKHFKKADSQFGYADKVGAKHTTSTQVVLQNALSDPNLAPEAIDTFYRTAVAADAEGVFKRAIEGHLRLGYEKAISIPEKGPLAGLDVLNWGQLEKQWGLGAESSVKWATTSRMIERAGGDPKAVKQFLADAKLMFPHGVPNPSQTAQRRTSLAGISNVVKFATGFGVLGGSGGGASGMLGGGLVAGTAGLITMLGIGEFMFNPSVMKKMSRVMSGGISEQGAWRTLFGVASSQFATRRFQDFLQDNNIDPLIDVRVAAIDRRAGAVKESLRDQLRLTPFSKNPLLPKAPNSTAIPENTIGPMRPGSQSRLDQ